MKKGNISVGKQNLTGGAPSKVGSSKIGGAKVKKLGGKGTSDNAFLAGYASGHSGHSYAIGKRVASYHSKRGK